MCSEQHVDVVVIGARIAGASLATHLARQGRSVLLLDREGFPSDTLSTHLIQVSGVRSMQRLGVLEELRATEAPYLERLRPVYDGIDLTTDVAVDDGWPLGGMSINRDQLDHILISAAKRAGAQVRLRAKVEALVRAQDGRVCGVRVTSEGTTWTVRSHLVVGADGRRSKVASTVGARTYNVTRNERFVYWGDYENVRPESPPTAYHIRTGGDLLIACWSDRGRFTVMVVPGLEDYPRFRSDPEHHFRQAVASCEPLRPLLESANRVERLTGTAHFPGYFRESAGPGWVLLGDAGQFKDPAIGQGISDALRQSEELARRLRAADLTNPGHLDRTTRRWWRWRDRDGSAMYWLAAEMSQAGPMDPLLREVLSCVSEDARVRQKFIDGVLSHRVSPYEVLTPRLIARASSRLRRKGLATTPEVLRLVARRLQVEAQHLGLRLRPRYAPLPTPADRPRATTSDATAYLQGVAS